MIRVETIVTVVNDNNKAMFSVHTEDCDFIIQDEDTGAELHLALENLDEFIEALQKIQEQYA